MTPFSLAWPSAAEISLAPSTSSLIASSRMSSSSTCRMPPIEIAALIRPVWSKIGAPSEPIPGVMSSSLVA